MAGKPMAGWRCAFVGDKRRGGQSSVNGTAQPQQFYWLLGDDGPTAGLYDAGAASPVATSGHAVEHLMPLEINKAITPIMQGIN